MEKKFTTISSSDTNFRGRVRVRKCCSISSKKKLELNNSYFIVCNNDATVLRNAWCEHLAREIEREFKKDEASAVPDEPS